MCKIMLSANNYFYFFFSNIYNFYLPCFISLAKTFKTRLNRNDGPKLRGKALITFLLCTIFAWTFL